MCSVAFCSRAKRTLLSTGNHVVAPAVDDRGRARRRPRAELLVTGHVERRRQQEHAARLQQRRTGDRHVAAHARADEHQRTAQVLAEREQPRDALLGIVEAAVVHRLDHEAFFARDFGHRRDLAAPGLAVLAMGEDHVTFRHAPARLTRHPVTARMIRQCRARQRGISSHPLPTCHSHWSMPSVALPQPWARRSARPLTTATPSRRSRATCCRRESRTVRERDAAAGRHDAMPRDLRALRQRREHASDQARAPRLARALGDGSVGGDLAARNPRHHAEDPRGGVGGLCSGRVISARC